MFRHGTIEESFAILGLENDASSDDVKSAYKKLAMKTHPDRNPGIPDATQRFQAVGAAYSTLTKHFDRTESGIYYNAYTQSDGSEYDEDDLYYSDEYYEADILEKLAFFKSLFEEVLREKLGRKSHQNFRTDTVQFPQEVPETVEEYQERLRLQRQEQENARQRHIAAEQQRKQRIQEEKERERLAAEERQRQRAAQKKAQAQSSKQTAAQRLRSQQERTQTLRSAVFAAARLGDTDAVKKGVWENSVDAAGGEIKRGSETFVPQMPKDPAETLLHIAANRGDADLIEWLVNHNAEADEHTSAGLTAFHLALQMGHISIIRFFFDKLPPSDDDYRAVYATPDSINLLHLAIESSEPELVWMILDNKLVRKRHISEAWSWVCSEDFKFYLTEKHGEVEERKNIEGKVQEIMNLLMAYGKFTSPPPSPKTKTQDVEQQAHLRAHGHKHNSKERKPHPSNPVINTCTPLPSSALQNPTPTATPTLSERSYQNSNTSPEESKGYFDRCGSTRGRGRGRGQGSGRGRVKGRARGQDTCAQS